LNLTPVQEIFSVLLSTLLDGFDHTIKALYELSLHCRLARQH